MKNEHRTLRVSVPAANIRAASFQGRQHIVFPVMACMEGVVHAMGSDAAELVPFDVLMRTEGQWNGKPIVGGHPIVNGEPVSANEPNIYERETFGLIFGSSTNERTRKLEVTAYIDPTKATTRIAQDVVQRLERAMSGDDVQPIEVSIGAFVALKNESGTFKGKPYKRVWTDLTADHLALLESGDRGACSFEMGCGVRAAQENDDMEKSIKDRFLSLITAGFRAGLNRDEMTDTDLRQSLTKALHSTVPAFLDVVSVTPAQKKVVYAAAPDGNVMFLETGYTLSSDGTITISAENPTEVGPRTKFEPLVAAEEAGTTAEQLAAASASRTACGCGGNNTATAPTPGGDSMDRKAKIASLAGHKKAGGRYTTKFLESLTDEQLGTLETELNALPEAEAPVITPTQVAAPAPTATEIGDQVKSAVTAALAAALPPELIVTLRSAHEAGVVLKDRTIKALTALGERCPYTAEELTAMTQPSLEKLLKLANAQRPSMRSAGGPFPREIDADDEPTEEDTAPSPERMSTQFVAARAAGGKK